MEKRVIGKILEAPAIILLVISFLGSIYAKVKNIAPIDNWGPAVILAIILALYFWGRSMESKSSKDIF